ncbi:sacsin-like [Apostichopus japonicus]|uniref:sacsin-like n=1 Tax=Stichopus japonicus TaxID=307972 RepID=UPI003AB3ECB7
MTSTVKGRGFGPTTPPLLEYLQQILRGYSDGQILKELLQNAEDARASEVKFIYDQRQFGTATLLNHGLERFQGPAIYAFNNAKFTEEDWEGIQKPARSVKKEDVLKVGRFGIGFSSVYHLTDLPCIVSDETLAIIDPFEEYFTDKRNRPLPGYSFNLKDIVDRHEVSDQLAPFLGVFEGQEDIKSRKSLQGTMFRFPLRVSPSKLCTSVFTQQEILKLLQAFKEDSLILLLFLRNVEKIDVFLRNSSTVPRNPYIQICLSTPDISSLRQNRILFNKQLEKYRSGSGTSDIELVERFDIKSSNGDVQGWVTAQVISNRESKQLQELADHLHHLPWVGIAVPLKDGKEKSILSRRCKGRIFCFLPLPEGDAGYSGLPVHVHGYFGVSDDRRSLKWPEVDQIQNPTATWNNLLVEVVLPDVYVKAILKTISVCKSEGRHVSCVYNALPDLETSLGHFQRMTKQFYRALFQYPVFFTEQSQTWKRASDVIIIDSEFVGDLRSLIIKCFRISSVDVVEELPKHVLQAVKEFASDAKIVNKQSILDTIRIMHLSCLTKDERLLLLTYLLDEGCTTRDLNGLELLLTRDDTFKRISANPASDQIVYLPTSQCSEALIPHMRHRLVTEQNSCNGGNLQTYFEKGARSGSWKQIKILTPGCVVNLLKTSLTGDWSGTYCTRKHLSSSTVHTWAWLKTLWAFISKHGLTRQLGNLNLLPISREGTFPIQLETLKVNSLIMKVDSNDERNFSEAVSVLKQVGVTVSDIPQFVTSNHDIYNSRFVNRFDTAGILFCLTQIGKLAIDEKCQNNSHLCDAFREKLLPFLNLSYCTNNNKTFLKTLAVYPLYSKKANMDLMPLVSNNFRLWKYGSMNNLPDVTFPFRVLYTDQKAFIQFLLYLDIPEIREEDVVKEILKKASVGDYSQSEKQTLVSWIPNHFTEVCRLQGGLEILRKIPFVPNGKNEQKLANALFDPQDSLLMRLFKDHQYFPSVNFLQRNSLWGGILQRLGYRPRLKVPYEEVLTIARQISSSNDVDQGKALCEFLSSRSDLLTPNACSELSHVGFMPCKSQRPHSYPRNLPFLGELGSNNVFCPNQLLKCTEENWLLAGSSAYLVNDQLSGIQVRSKPTLTEVCNHLKNISCNYDMPSVNLASMLHAMYKFMNGSSDRNQLSTLLPTKWIWTGEYFASSDEICWQETLVDLRPLISPIPKEYRVYRDLYQWANVPGVITTDHLLQFLHQARTKLQTSSSSKDVHTFLELSTRILTRLLDTEEDLHLFKDRLFVPTTSKELLPVEEVSFCDYDWLHWHTMLHDGTDDIKVISDKFSITMAERLGVAPLSRRLAMADEIVEGISQTGQYEPITTRIRNILADVGYQSSSIPKEMIQNAEDAGATEVRFLIDMRSNNNARKQLLSDGMVKLQGPALWIYNDAVFSDIDLENITKLAGGTKSTDNTKIGQFGLGFNAVYHITDVPSFVTRNYINFFDPHKKFLARQIQTDGRGIRLDFTKNPSLLKTFRDQFVPFEGIFGCHLSGDSLKEFNGTLFRLPLRSPEDARCSEICNESWNESDLKQLLKSLSDSAGLMLLFTEQVKVIEAHILRRESDQVEKLFSVKRTVMNQSPNSTYNSFGQEVVKAIRGPRQSPPMNCTKTIQLKHNLTEKGNSYFNEHNFPFEKDEEWMTVLSTGKGPLISFWNDNTDLASGLLPCGGVAWRKYPKDKIDGEGFCFLPLSIPKSHLPVHVNGSFALSDDRASIWKYMGDHTDRSATFKTRWNELILSDVVLSAYLTFLKQAFADIDPRESYSLWPDQRVTAFDSDYGELVNSFYMSVARGAPDVFWCSEERVPCSILEVVFVDNDIANNEFILNLVSTSLKKFGNAKLVTKLPNHVFDAFMKVGCQSDVTDRTYSLSRFFAELFLPRLDFFTEKEVHMTLQFALDRCDGAVLQLMKSSKCIPSSSNGSNFKLPSELYDQDVIGNLFSSEEGYFPSDRFLKLLSDRQKGTLRDIGCMKTGLEWDELIDRASTVQHVWRQNRTLAKQRSNAIVVYLRTKLEASNKIPTCQPHFTKIRFLIGQDHNGDSHLKSPVELYPNTFKYIVGWVACIIEAVPASVMTFLDLNNKHPDPSLVFENLSSLRRMCEERSGNHPNREITRRACREMYGFLEREFLTREDVLHVLRNDRCFYVNSTFVDASKLSFHSKPVPPYIYSVTGDLAEFEVLLNSVGVKQHCSADDFAKALRAINGDYYELPLPKELLHDVITSILKPLTETIGEFSSESRSKFIECLFLPDVKGIMQVSSRLSFCDVDWVGTDEAVLCHPDITSHQAILLGVKDIRQQLLEKYSEDVHPGEEFGQREELTSRLKRILTGYPCDASILKEIVQNADDAGATEVHFVLDFKSYPKTRLLSDAMECLQGPALLAYNNKPFSENDIKGIQRLGQGSKRDESGQTGRYGVGFNVVYHLTDCPMFMTCGSTLCIMDPTLRYVPGANVKSPGRRYNSISESIQRPYPDFFECFNSYGKVFNLAEGTLFRFPLRRGESDISEETWRPSKVWELLDELKEELFDILLFVRNVQKISVSNRDVDHTNLSNVYTVSAHISHEEKLRRDEFFKVLLHHADTPLSTIPVTDVTSELTLKDSEGYEERWLVQQRIGLENKEIPTSIVHALKKNTTELKLLPKGGVAARIWQPQSSQSIELRNVQYKAFCFLPLPLLTGFPVHIDGYFALDHESRRNLWYGPLGDAKNDWNELIKKEVLGPAYLHLLLEIKIRLSETVVQNKRRQFAYELLNLFHNCFPTCKPKEKRTGVNPWNIVSESLYILISVNKCKIFPVLRSLKDESNDANITKISWHSCHEGNDAAGYFDDLRLQIPNTKFGHPELAMKATKEPDDWKSLQQTLLDLDFHLLAAPIKIYNSFVSAVNNTLNDNGTRTVDNHVLKVTPEVVLSFLKICAHSGKLNHLPTAIGKTPFKTNLQLMILIDYVKKTDNFTQIMDGLPLLLTCDGVLRTFSKSSKVFHSQFYKLLPNCKDQFLNPMLLHHYEATDVFETLKISDLSKRLRFHPDALMFCSDDLIMWPNGPITSRKGPTLKAEWLNHVWKYIQSRWRNYNQAHNSFVGYCHQHLQGISLLPVSIDHGQRFLCPMNMSKKAINSCSGHEKTLHEILVSLGCPVLDVSSLKEMNYNAFVPSPTDLDQVLQLFPSSIGVWEEVMHVFANLLNRNCERFETLKPKQRNEILEYFSRCIHDPKCNVLLLKKLPCYETIHGAFVALDKYAVAIDTYGIPSDDKETWMGKHDCVFLKKKPNLLKLYVILEIKDINEETLYTSYILPYMASFSQKGLWRHMYKIYTLILNVQHEERKELVYRLNLPTTPVILTNTNERKCAGDLFDSRIYLFKVMLPAEMFPQTFPKDMGSLVYDFMWEDFLVLIGLQNRVTPSQILTFATDLASGLRDIGGNHGKTKKPERDKILFEHLLDSHELHSDYNLLQNLSKVAFISAAKVSKKYTSLMKPITVTKVCLNASPASKESLVWSTEALCPSWVTSYRQTICSRKKCITPCMKKLGVRNEPTLQQVLQHTQTLCNCLGFQQNTDDKGVTVDMHTLLQVMCDIVRFLSSECETKRDSNAKSSCFTPNKCCNSCKLVVEKLESVPIVPIIESKNLIRAEMVVKTWNDEENDKLSPHLHKLPDDLISYFALLHCLGATETPTLAQYARVLESLNNSRSDVLVYNPNMAAAAKQAMSGFLRCLLRHQYDGKPSEVLNNMQNLYLMSNNKTQPLVQSRELFYNDRPQFAKRLTGFPGAQLIAISQDDIGKPANVDELLRTLPPHIRPAYISDHVQEVIVTALDEDGNTECRCSTSRRLKKIFEWEQFPKAIQCIVAHEIKDGNQSNTEERLNLLLQSTFTVKCIEKLETSLYFEGVELPGSTSNTSCLLKKQEVENINGRQNITVCISHSETADSMMNHQLATKFNEIFRLINNISHLVLILSAQSEEELSNILNDVGIGTATLEEERFWDQPELGTNLPPDAIALLNQDPMYIFKDKECIGVDCGEGEEELIIYGRIMRRVDMNSSDQEPWKAVYEIDIGQPETQRVVAHKLFKFLSLHMDHHLAVQLYEGTVDDSASGEDPGEGLENFTDLAAVKREITKTVREVMQLPEADKKKMLRRLMLKWHPDKNIEHREFAQEVFKHLQREIERFEKGGNFSTEDFYDDVNRRARYYEGERRRWEQQFRESTHRQAHNRRRNSTAPPPSFYPRKNILGARRFLKQARVDQFVADSKEASDMTWQWQCQLYYFAAEKAMSAALLACGKGTMRINDIMRAADNLRSYHLNVTKHVEKLIKIVKNDSHYPRSEASASIPQENFTRGDFEKAKKLCQSILQEVECFVRKQESEM